MTWSSSTSGPWSSNPTPLWSHDKSIFKLYIEYQFLGINQEELETPFSIPKPGPGGPYNLSYNFYKGEMGYNYKKINNGTDKFV